MYLCIYVFVIFYLFLFDELVCSNLGIIPEAIEMHFACI